MSEQMTNEEKGIRRYLLISFAIVLALFGGLGVWSAIASISGAVIAPGSVIVQSHRKNVQHLQGGIVSDILVKDGDVVAPGDLLVRLDETLPKANLGIITSQLDELEARKARLEAERGGLPEPDFPEHLLDRKDDPIMSAVLGGQKTLLDARRESLNGQRSQLQERIGQLRQEIVGLEAQRDAKNEEIVLIEDELSGLRDLEKKGLVPKSRVVALKRQAAQLNGDRGRFIAEIARARGRIGETEIQIIQLEKDRRTEVETELREVQTRISELLERKVAAEDQLKRIEVRAPIGGYVHQMAFHTVGGVVQAGETIMQIVPAKDLLLIEARLDPADIDQVYIGQDTVVRFPSFNQRTTPELNGSILHISADVSKDDSGETEFYTAHITLSGDEVKRLGDRRLVPGMPAETFVQTESRTALSYLLKPLSDQIEKAFREE
ncbi:MAG: HlyD family type I secretion periplasmic adaptor subunit [Hyphomicrobiaceae bacterium]|nr:HlyD family type I secretion periplasmic adaptor subunit [Hyphomicrobiaceae bacterium]